MTNEWIDKKNKKQILEMDAMIRDKAIRGFTDYDLNGAIDIYWKMIGERLFAYIEFLESEENETMQYGFRIFDNVDSYEKKLIVIPLYESDVYRCIYDHVESVTGETKHLFIDESFSREMDHLWSIFDNELLSDE